MDVALQIANKFNVTLSDKSLKELSLLFHHKFYVENEVILDQDQISKHMYFIQKGIIRQYYYKDGRDITEHFSSEGDLVACLESLFLKQVNNLIVETIEPSEVYLINYSDLVSLSLQNSEIANMLRRSLELMLVVSQRKADSWRFENSSERYERFCLEYPEAVKRAPIAHIATYLLMTPETLSRVRSGKR